MTMLCNVSKNNKCDITLSFFVTGFFNQNRQIVELALLGREVTLVCEISHLTLCYQLKQQTQTNVEKLLYL